MVTFKGSVSPSRSLTQYGDSEIPSKPYFVVQSYEELLEVYAYATERPSDFGSYSLGIKGNWRRAMQDNAYTEDFFNDGYVVVVWKA